MIVEQTEKPVEVTRIVTVKETVISSQGVAVTPEPNPTYTPYPTYTAKPPLIQTVIVERKVTNVAYPTQSSLQVTYLGEDGSKLIGSNCPGTDFKGTVIDSHLKVLGVVSQKTVTKVIVDGIPGSRWMSPCNPPGPEWGLKVVKTSTTDYDLYFAPVPNISKYKVTIQYIDGTKSIGETN